MNTTVIDLCEGVSNVQFGINRLLFLKDILYFSPYNLLLNRYGTSGWV